MQPGGDGGFAPEGVSAPEGRNERILDGIGSHLRVAGGAHGESPHPVAVPTEELTERIRVAAAVCREQLAIGELKQVVQARHQGALS